MSAGRRVVVLLLVCLSAFGVVGLAFGAGTVSLSLMDGAVTENFDSLASSGSSSVTPTGWALHEGPGSSSTGGAVNGAYTAGTGSSGSGDVYSFGSALANDRAFGTLLSGSITPTIGASFVNDTGTTISSLSVAYTGEQWRLGNTAREDRLDFQISTDATFLNTGTWTNVDTLDFVAPVRLGATGALNGNGFANRASISAAVPGLNIPPGATFWVRWSDFNASGADDGLAVDDFSLTPRTTVVNTLSVNDVSVSEGDSGSTSATFAITSAAPAPAAGISFDVATQNGTATTSDGDYAARSAHLTIPPGARTTTFSVDVHGDVRYEPNETFSVVLTNPSNAEIGDGSGVGTIQNDDPVPPTKISEIQGSGSSSPMAGTSVTIEGIVIGVDDEIGASFGSNNSIIHFPEDAGIFVQEETADEDGNAATSEGIFVGYVSSRMNIPLGSKVRLSGQVKEKFGLTMIEETLNTEPVVLISGGALPSPVVVDVAQAESQSIVMSGASVIGKTYYETFESMRAAVTAGVANSGSTNKFGELFLTPGDRVGRVFRDEVAPSLLAADSDAGAGNPSNPYTDTDSSTRVEADLFDRVEDLVGPLGFSFGHYKLMPQIGVMPTVLKGSTMYPYTGVTAPGLYQLRIASFNVENYFPVGGALDGGTISAEEYELKKARIVDAIDRLLLRPDVIAVQEVVDLTILQDVAATLGGYTAFLEEGNDNRGIDVGFLVKSTVLFSNARQLGKDAPGTCSDVAGRLFDRPPLAIDIAAPVVSFTIITNHFSSKAAPDSCRAAQAAFVRDRVDELEASGSQVIVVGDLNAFEDESALTTLEDGVTTLTNLWSQAPEQERYSFAFQGRLQTLDHVLVTDGLDERVAGFQYSHFDNDYYERALQPDGHKVSDHDAPLLTLSTDACLNGDDLPTVVLGGEDTGVPNADTGQGCTIGDVIGEPSAFRNHGQYVSHVSHVTNGLVERGVLSGKEKGAIQRAAAQNK